MSDGFGATHGRAVVVPFGVSVAIFVIFTAPVAMFFIFGTTPIVCNATRGAGGGFQWSEH